MVEGRFEELVLQHQALIRSDSLIDLREAVSEPVLTAPDITLAGVVGAVGKPDLQVSRPGLVHDLDALEMVVDRLAAYRLIDVGQAAELVDVVLEGVGVDRAERYTKISGIVPERSVVLDLVPRDVQRNLRCKPGQFVHLGSVRELFLDGSRCARRSEHLESGTGVPERPGRQLNGLMGQLIRDVGKGWHVRTHFQESPTERLYRCSDRPEAAGRLPKPYLKRSDTRRTVSRCGGSVNCAYVERDGPNSGHAAAQAVESLQSLRRLGIAFPHGAVARSDASHNL